MNYEELFINGRFLTQPMTGVNRYAYQLCKAMAAAGHPFVLVCPKAPFHDSYDTNDFHIVRYGVGSSHFWEQCVLPFFFLGKRNYLLMSFTGLGSILVRPKIMTIHDLAFLKNPSWYTRSYYLLYRFLTPLAVRTSRHVITVSEFSKQEILRFYPFIDEQRISVVYNAADSTVFRPSVESEVQTIDTKPFVLAVSSIDPRKNFSRLIQAFKGISNCQLLIVGKYSPVFKQQGGLDEHDPHIRFLGRVTDDELLQLYNTASCFVFPSLYEGFGLPPLEAMACGCPVLASDIPVIREVCADAAWYFTPTDPDAIRSTIQRFLNSPASVREQLRQQGFRNITRFSWKQSAEKILALWHDYSPSSHN